MADCEYCGDELISFAEELEDGSIVYLVMCPTCYRTKWSSKTNTSPEPIAKR